MVWEIQLYLYRYLTKNGNEGGYQTQVGRSDRVVEERKEIECNQWGISDQITRYFESSCICSESRKNESRKSFHKNWKKLFIMKLYFSFE